MYVVTDVSSHGRWTGENLFCAKGEGNMKHLALGLGILAVLFSLGLWSQAKVTRATEEVAQALEQGQVEKAKEQWDAHYGFLASFLEHRILDEVDQSFDELEHGEDVQKLIKLVRKIQKEDRLTYYNLLSCNVSKNLWKRLAG